MAAILDEVETQLPASLAARRRFDFGKGCLALLASTTTTAIGDPANIRRLFNVHLDTVPAGEGWSRDPFALRVEGDRAFGRGACDVKGAAACLLAALASAGDDLRRDTAVLFTTDEEAGQSRCVRTFLREYAAAGRGPAPEFVVVAEPTGGRVVGAHRGLATCTGVFRGRAGHGSLASAVDDSAIHRAVRWAARALDYAKAREEETYGELRGIRFNIGLIEGGIKANVIAPGATLRYGLRPLPCHDVEAMVREIGALAGGSEGEGEVEWTPGFRGPPLPARSERGDDAAAEIARRFGLETGPAVDFWTEASLFSEAGWPAVVLGPGDIVQAHAADEWVALSQLDAASAAYARLLSS